MLNHNTTASQDTASATGQESQNQFVFFNSQSTLNTSAIFSVDTTPWYIQAANLADGETVTLQTVTGFGTTAVYADCYIAGFPVQLTNVNNKIRVDYSGRYRLVFAGADVSTINVVGFPAEMTHEPVMGVVASLANIGNNFIEGVSPIVVNGTGTNVDPYQISVTLATDLEEENGLPAINVISAGVLKHIVNATTANRDTRLGVDAGLNNNGTDNNFIGYSVAVNGEFSSSTIIGEGWGSEQGGIQNVVIGNRFEDPVPVNDNSVFTDCTFIGYRTGTNLSPNSDWRRCIGIGSHCFNSTNTAVNDAICIGYLSGGNPSLLSNRMIAIGTGTGNTANMDEMVAIGYNANGGLSTSGFHNVCIGSGAGSASSLASSVCVGFEAGLAGEGEITAIGNSAARATQSFNEGVAAGAFSGANSQYLLATVAIGHEAGLNVDYTAQHPPLPAPQTFSDGIFIGKGAGKNETFFDVIVIGQDATGQLNATQNHQIILGTAAQTQLVTAGSVIQGGVIGPSDQRLKSDIKPMESALEKVTKLNPVTFTWNKNALNQANIAVVPEDLERKQNGVIAQEVEKVFPEIIDKINRGFGDYNFVHYDRLIPALIGAVKELAEKNAALEERLHKLEKKK